MSAHLTFVSHRSPCLYTWAQQSPGTVHWNPEICSLPCPADPSNPPTLCQTATSFTPDKYILYICNWWLHGVNKDQMWWKQGWEAVRVICGNLVNESWSITRYKHVWFLCWFIHKYKPTFQGTSLLNKQFNLDIQKQHNQHTW